MKYEQQKDTQSLQNDLQIMPECHTFTGDYMTGGTEPN